MYYLLRYYTASGAVFTKGVLEFAVKILHKYNYKEFLKIPFQKLKL